MKLHACSVCARPKTIIHDALWTRTHVNRGVSKKDVVGRSSGKHVLAAFHSKSCRDHTMLNQRRIITMPAINSQGECMEACSACARRQNTRAVRPQEEQQKGQAPPAIFLFSRCFSLFFFTPGSIQLIFFMEGV